MMMEIDLRKERGARRPIGKTASDREGNQPPWQDNGPMGASCRLHLAALAFAPPLPGPGLPSASHLVHGFPLTPSRVNDRFSIVFLGPLRISGECRSIRVCVERKSQAVGDSHTSLRASWCKPAASGGPDRSPADRPMRFPTGLRALTHRDFRLFFAGQVVSLIGTWTQRVAQSWLVLELTNSPFKLGLISALQSAPMLCLAFIAGVIADRLPKRRVLIGTQTALMIQAFVLAVLAWTGHVQYWHVALLATCYGLAFTLDMPTRQSFIVEMASKEDLPNAIALNSTMVSGARMVGPAIAGLLVDRYGVASACGLNGLSFVAVILALAAMRADGLPSPAQGTSVRQDIAAGLHYAARTPLVALILSLVLALGLFVMNHNVLVPLLARDVLHEGAHGFGLLMAAVGTGAIIGALTLATLAKGRPPLSLLLGTAAAASGLTLLLAAIRNFWSAMLVLTLIGFSQMVFLASCNSTLQLEVPDRMRGRIMSFYAFVFVGITPLGSLVVGTIAEWFGVAVAYALSGGMTLASILGLGLLWRRGRA